MAKRQPFFPGLHRKADFWHIRPVRDSCYCDESHFAHFLANVICAFSATSCAESSSNQRFNITSDHHSIPWHEISGCFLCSKSAYGRIKNQDVAFAEKVVPNRVGQELV